MPGFRAKVEGVDAVQAVFRRMAIKHGRRVRLVVGYAAPYAVYVHEDLEMFHLVGQAKYLEQPARENARTMAKLVENAVRAGRSMAQALALAGGYLLNVSRPLVPVDTGFLKSSGFVKIEDAT